MGPYVIRSWNAHVKSWEDSVKDSVNDPLEQTQDSPAYLPDCVCRWQAPPECINTLVPCCGLYGCGQFQETVQAEICTPIGCNDPNPPGKQCADNPQCCSQVYNDDACGEGSDPSDPCPCLPEEMCQKAPCGAVGVFKKRCMPGHPTCANVCSGMGVLPPAGSLESQKYGPMCPGDDINIFPPNNVLKFITEGTCSVPPNSDPTNKCQMECNDPFAPDTAGGQCKCPGNALEDTYTPQPSPPGQPTLYCRCGGYVEKADCDPGEIWVDRTHCAADEALGCTDLWNCCTNFSARGPIQTPDFYEDTEHTWVGASCPNEAVVSGIETRNFGKGGHNRWHLFCYQLPPTCWTGQTTKVAFNPVTTPWNAQLPPPALPHFYENDNSGQWIGNDCPNNYVMTGVWTRNKDEGGHNWWFIECAEINPSCLDTRQTWSSASFYGDTEGRWVGAKAPSCTLVNGFWTKHKRNAKGGHNDWMIKGIQ